MRRPYLKLRRRVADGGMSVNPGETFAIPHDHPRHRATVAMD